MKHQNVNEITPPEEEPAVDIETGSVEGVTERELYDAFSALAEDPEEVSVEYAIHAQAEVVLQDDDDRINVQEPYRPMNIPRKIKICRFEDYHTDTIGHCSGQRPFMAFVVATVPYHLSSTTAEFWENKRWYAVLHTFQRDGLHDATEARFVGTSTDESATFAVADRVLETMLAGLGDVEYGDIEVCLFSTETDGQTFGLLDTSDPEYETVSVTLEPNDLMFFPPWDGSFDT